MSEFAPNTNSSASLIFASSITGFPYLVTVEAASDEFEIGCPHEHIDLGLIVSARSSLHDIKEESSPAAGRQYHDDLGGRIADILAGVPDSTSSSSVLNAASACAVVTRNWHCRPKALLARPPLSCVTTGLRGLVIALLLLHA